MKIAIISDIHDNFGNLVKALKIIKKKKPEQVVFLGDFCSNGIAKVLANFSIPIFAIWGNNDGDRTTILKTSLQQGSNLSIGTNIYEVVEFGGRKIFLSHFHDFARSIAKSGDFDAVFFGHTHERFKEFLGDCLLLNPGELSGHRTGEVGFAIYDTKMNDVEMIKIDEPILVKTKETNKYMGEQGIKFRVNKI